MLTKQDKQPNTENRVELKEEQRGCLSCDNISNRCSSLDLEDNISPEQEELAKQLAEIVVEAILWEIDHENRS